MPKIFSILTLLVALGATFLGFKGNESVTKLQESFKKEHEDLLATRSKLKKTEEKLKATEDELANTKAELEKTKETLRTTEAELAKTKGELTMAKDALAVAEKTLADLKAELEKMGPGVNVDNLKQTIAGLQAKTVELEAKVQTLEKEKAELTTTVETLTARNKDLDDKVAVQTKEIRRYRDGIMEKGVRGRVLAVNSGWGFCVLSIGDNKGAAANRIMVVARGGQAIGKVKITNVEASQSVADILPGTFLKGVYVQPGDEVIYTGDDKVKVEDGTPGGGSPPVSSPLLPALPVP